LQDIPLVRARYARVFAAVLDRVGAPTKRLWNRAGLPGHALHDGEAVLPARPVWSFIGSAARREGIDDLGLRAGDVSIEAYGKFSSRLLQTANLNQAAETFCRLARNEYSRADFYVWRDPQRVLFCRGPIDGDAVEKKHVELLVLTMMIAVVRLAAGRNWRPVEVLLQSADSRGVQTHESLSLADLRFNNEITAFEIPHHLLPKPLPKVALPQSAGEYDLLNCDFLGAVRHVIASLLDDGDVRISPVAEAVGIRRRTLQRRLSEASTTFSSLVEEVRMTRAISVLADDSVALGEIAIRLGYSDQSNFSRAFRRWTGVSPQAYRLLQLADHQDGTD
jgi:AraC-like DNA-binding protein